MNQILNGESAKAKAAPKSVVKPRLTQGQPQMATVFEVYKYDKMTVTRCRIYRSRAGITSLPAK
jgi:hypothetical protein